MKVHTTEPELAGETTKLQLHPERYFSASKEIQEVALRLFQEVRNLPIISPHGHADPQWFARNEPFGDPTSVLVQVDHYVFRMLYSQGVKLSELGICRPGEAPMVSQRDAWRTFASYYHLFRGTPTRLWMDYVFSEIFGLDVVLCKKTAELYYDAIDTQLHTDEMRPNSVLRTYNIECLATTEGALDSLEHHQTGSHPGTLVIPTFRPDDVIDPDRPDFAENVAKLGDIAQEDTTRWSGYLLALWNRREFFRSKGATATDHGHPTARTANVDNKTCQRLLSDCLSGSATPEGRELFRAQLLTEMARMSVDDGMVMQLHVGAMRNHNGHLFEAYGADMGADIPSPTNYVDGLRPLLEKYGNQNNLTLIAFTLDESTYSRELAPLAGHYPGVKLGAPWWIHDSPEGMLRFRRRVTETAGFANLVGFCDDARGLLSIPARHDMARRLDCRFLAEWVLDRRLIEEDALEIARELTYELPKQAYKLPDVGPANNR